MAQFGQRLRHARRDAGLTLRTVGDRLGLSAGQISKYEKGLDVVPASRLPQLVAVLGIRLGWLFGEVAATEDAADERAQRWRPLAAELAELLARIPSEEQRDLVLRLIRSLAARRSDASGAAPQTAALWKAGAEPPVPAGRAAGPARLRDRLYDALAGNRPELALYYQPLVRARDGGLHGFEGLLRWDGDSRDAADRNGDSSRPERLVQDATAFGLAEALDWWVLRRGAEQAADWRRFGEDFRISVNLTGGLLGSPTCVGQVAAVLAATRCPPAALTLEVVETTVLDAPMLANLRALRALGVSLAIDDFGVGQSSVSRLRALAVDMVKLDRGFLVGRGALGADDRAFLGALVRLTHARKALAVAAGVETPLHAEAATAAGCDLLQGFWFARALPPAEALAWGRARRVAGGPPTAAESGRAP